MSACAKVRYFQDAINRWIESDNNDLIETFHFLPAIFLSLAEHLNSNQETTFHKSLLRWTLEKSQTAAYTQACREQLSPGFHRLTSSDINRQLERAGRSMIGRLQVCKKFVIILFYFISDYSLSAESCDTTNVLRRKQSRCWFQIPVERSSLLRLS